MPTIYHGCSAEVLGTLNVVVALSYIKQESAQVSYTVGAGLLAKCKTTSVEFDILLRRQLLCMAAVGTLAATRDSSPAPYVIQL